MSPTSTKTQDDLPDGLSDFGLVLHQGAIGDFILTLSLVQAVRSQHPVQRVAAVASAASARLAAGRSVVDECLSPEGLGMHTLFLEAGPIDERLSSWIGGAAWVLSCLGDAQARPSARIACLRDAGCLWIDPRPRGETVRERRHITAQWAGDLRSAGVEIPEPSAPWITLPGCEHSRPHPSPDRRRQRQQGTGISPVGTGRETAARRAVRRIVIHPGSGAREKCWPFERFLEVADGLTGVQIQWLLGPAEMERFPEWTEILQTRMAADPRQSLVVEPDLARVAEHLSAADLYLGNDGGITHLAAALGIPTIALFGPTDPRVWRPLNPNVTVVAPRCPGAIGQIGAGEVAGAVRNAVISESR